MGVMFENISITMAKEKLKYGDYFIPWSSTRQDRRQGNCSWSSKLADLLRCTSATGLWDEPCWCVEDCEFLVLRSSNKNVILGIEIWNSMSACFRDDMPVSIESQVAPKNQLLSLLDLLSYTTVISDHPSTLINLPGRILLLTDWLNLADGTPWLPGSGVVVGPNGGPMVRRPEINSSKVKPGGTGWHSLTKTYPLVN